MTYVNEYLLRKNLLILPRMENNLLILHQAGGPLIRNKLGVWEPEKSAPQAKPQLGLIPGLAFDDEGNRIGYGKGYYDRLLPTLEIPTIGIAFEEQLYANLVVHSHDYKLDRVITF